MCEAREALADCFSSIQANALQCQCQHDVEVVLHLVYFTVLLISIVITASCVNVNLTVTRISFFFSFRVFLKQQKKASVAFHVAYWDFVSDK